MSRWAAKTVATPSPMAVCPSWPQACMTPGFSDRKPSRTGNPVRLVKFRQRQASMSNRSATVGPAPQREHAHHGR